MSQSQLATFHTDTLTDSRTCCTPSQSFDQLLEGSSLPPPGPLRCAARRRLWLTPRSDLQINTEPSPMRLKLEEVLNRPGALQSEEIWKAGIEKVWKGLVGGGRLKKRLPMGIVVRRTPYVRQIVVESFQIKIIHAGWLRDPNTWPAAPIADDVLEEGPLLPTVPLTSWSVPDP